jgi:predicted PurR-regulated permease PerM
MLITDTQLSRQVRYVIAGGSVALVVLFLWTVRSVLAPFVWAAMAAYLLNPPTTWLQRQMRVRRIWAVAAVYVVLTILLVWGLLVMVPRILAELTALSLAAPAVTSRLQGYLLGDQPLQVLGFEADLSRFTDEIGRALATSIGEAWQQALHAVIGLVEAVFKVLLFVLASFYLLLDSDKIGRAALRLTPHHYRAELVSLARDVDDVLARFIRGELLLVLIMSVVTYVSLLALRMPYALVLGLTAGVLELIPIIGPITAATPAVIIALVRPSPFGWPQPVPALVVAGVYFVLRHLEDYFVIPNVIGRVVHVHPLVAIFSVIAGGTVAGILGMLLAVPAAAIAKIVGRYLYLKVTA